MTIVIVEGSDLSGKTTAIETISKHFNEGFILKNAYKPKTKAESNKVVANYWHILKLIINEKNLVLLDRFYPSQMVYSYLRGEDEMRNSDLLSIESLCRYNNILNIKCQP